MTGLGNVFGGILGGLAAGTAVTTANTDYYNINVWPQGTNTVGLQAAQWQSGTYHVQNNVYAQTAQWLGQIPGTAQFNWYTYSQLGGNTIQSPEMWVRRFTPEELKAMEIAEEKRRIEREAAKVSATALLRSQLDKEQLEQFERDGHFDVKIADRVYRITPGRKVHALHEKQKPHLCIAPQYAYELPNEDVALAQKLLLEANEKEFLKTAIRWAA